VIRYGVTRASPIREATPLRFLGALGCGGKCQHQGRLIRGYEVISLFERIAAGHAICIIKRIDFLHRAPLIINGFRSPRRN